MSGSPHEATSTGGDDVTDIDEAFLAERERIRGEATPGRWRKGHWRNGDEDVPWSVFSEPYPGHAYAVAMCPRYGKDRFSVDADLIVDAVNHQPALIAEIRRLQLLLQLVRSVHGTDLGLGDSSAAEEDEP